jgi:hypothetical protein
MHAQSHVSLCAGKLFARSHGCAAYFHRERMFNSRQRSHCREHAVKQATWRGSVLVTLDDEDIEQIARRVAELVSPTRTGPETRYVDAASIAQILDVDREWVYKHARALGALRLDSPGGRLRFNVQQVVAALALPKFSGRSRRRVSSRRQGARLELTGIIPYEH